MMDTKQKEALDENIRKLWDDYASKNNKLSRKMRKAGLDPELLDQVVQAAYAFYTYKVGARGGRSV